MGRYRGENQMARLLSELAEDIVARYERERVRLLADLVRTFPKRERIELVGLLVGDLLEGDDGDE